MTSHNFTIKEADADNPSHVAGMATIFLSTPDPMHFYRAPHSSRHRANERDYITTNYAHYLQDRAYVGYLLWFQTTNVDASSASASASSSRTRSITTDDYLTGYPALDAKRARAAGDALRTAWGTYFGGYGDNAMELAELFVHADWQRRGLGSRLLQWGIDKAAADGLHLVVFSCEEAEPFYRRAGFVAVGRFETRVDGEEASVVTVAMVKEHTP